MIVVIDKRTGRKAFIMQENFEKMKRVARYLSLKDNKNELVIMVY